MGEPSADPASGLHVRKLRLKAGDTLIPDMVKVIYKDVDARLHAPAAHSVLAHMIHLVEAGRATADGPFTLATRYHAA